MSDNVPQNYAGPDTQQERWLKYGANVAVTIVLVVAIVVIAVYVVQKKDRRLDTTSSGEFSLKPQTLNVIRNLKDPVRLVSLYVKPTAAERETDAVDYAGAVTDLLEEYKRSGKNVEVEFIDPQAEPAKTADLLKDVTEKYGGEVKRYREFIAKSKGQIADFKAFVSAEGTNLATAIPAPSAEPMSDESFEAYVQRLSATLTDRYPDQMDADQKAIDAAMANKPVDYKTAAAAFDDAAVYMSQIADNVTDKFQRIAAAPAEATNNRVTPAAKQYLADAVKRFAAIKVKADAVDAEFKKLGDLKLDEVQQKISQKDAILILGPDDMRSLSKAQVWPAETDRRQLADAAAAGPTGVKAKPKFLGEQQVTGAILAVTSTKKPRVVIVRPGGAPLTTAETIIQDAGPFSRLADRLRAYNFDVQEKDASGEYAMQAQMRGMPAAPEPTDAEMDDAVLIVFDAPTPPRQQQMPGMPPPPSPLDPLLQKHLAAGGSAVVLSTAGADRLSAALDPWGIDLRTDLMAVHEEIKAEATTGTPDQIEQLRKAPAAWVIDSYGDNPADPITKPLKSLDTLVFRCNPVATSSRPGYTATPMLPFPQTIPSWGEHDLESMNKGDPVTFDEKAGDVPPPLFGGAAVQGPKGGRVVAIGSFYIGVDILVAGLDPELRKRNVRAVRFPGNGELLCDSVFWAAHLDQLIAISPGGMDVSRIGSMSDASLRFWRVGLLLVGLPGLVVAAGVGVYLVRRS